MQILKIFALASLLIVNAYAEARLDVGSFSKQELRGWQQESFAGLTDYQVVQVKGRSVLQAHSEQSASAYYLPIKVDLQQTPVLNWSWRKEKVLDPGDESQKDGDDFVARVYVVKDGGLAFWRTLAINYVWSYQHQEGEVWNNPFAGRNAKMVSLRDVKDPAMQWFAERRNIVEDFKNIHGKDIRFIDGVAIMTDSDNSGASAVALYGDIYFTAR